MTIADGRIVSIDTTAADGGILIDARGRPVVPGLVDAHVHLLMGGLGLRQLDLAGVRSREAFEAAIEREHERLPADRWLIAGGWTQEDWGGAMPDRSWLDAAGNRPVVCYRMDLHAAVVNEAVLALIDLESDPPGGRIVCDPATGKPTGLLLEAAVWERVNPIVPEPDVAEKRQALLAAQQHAHSLGLTAVGSMEYSRDIDSVFLPMREQLTLRTAVTLLDRGWPMACDYGLRFNNDDRLRVVGYKAFVDGTLGSRTARLFEEYADDPGNRGMLVELAAQGRLFDWARTVAAAGLSPSIHAIGDEAVHQALNAIEPLEAAVRPRIEHAQQIIDDDVPRFRDVVASMQPLHKADDARTAERRLGRRRLAELYRFRDLLDAGAVLVFGSDWPVVPCDPLAGMRVAITGLTVENQPFGTDQNLTVEEALRASTSAPADALGLDDVGVLREGAAGDFLVLDRDPFTADWAAAPPRPVLTVVGGQIVFDARDGTPADVGGTD